MKVIQTPSRIRWVEHGAVISDLHTQSGPTHSIFDVLATAIGNLKELQPKDRVAILGFAGGGIIAPLHALRVAASLHACDLDRDSYRLFRRHCPHWASQIRWHHADAAVRLRSQPNDYFSVIVEDLSISSHGDVHKPDVSWTALPRLIRDKLKPDGIAVFNLLRPYMVTWNDAMNNILPHFKAAQIIHLDDFENRILIAAQHLPPSTRVGRALRSGLRQIQSRQTGRLGVRTARINPVQSKNRPNFLSPATRVLLAVVPAVFLLGCNAPQKSAGPSDPDWLAWRAKRQESIAGVNGWTTLVGRHWLGTGETFVGSSPTNQFILPVNGAPAAVGTFVRENRDVRFEAAAGVLATIDGHIVQSAPLISDASNSPTRLVVGELTFVVIERGDRIGVRVRDPAAPGRKNFHELACFRYDPSWKIQGRYEPFPSPRTLRVDDVTGGTQDLVSPGTLIFKHAGAEHRLDVVEEPGEADFFVIFRDQTAGHLTYASGRFLYVTRPGVDAKVTIDFNRAYTPPCGFTKFATCPLPPRQNWLPFPVRAGELLPKH